MQEAVKGKDLTAQTLADAQLNRTVTSLFMATHRKLTKSKPAHATYNMNLIKATFTAVEFDNL